MDERDETASMLQALDRCTALLEREEQVLGRLGAWGRPEGYRVSDWVRDAARRAALYRRKAQRFNDLADPNLKSALPREHVAERIRRFRARVDIYEEAAGIVEEIAAPESGCRRLGLAGPD